MTIPVLLSPKDPKCCTVYVTSAKQSPSDSCSDNVEVMVNDVGRDRSAHRILDHDTSTARAFFISTGWCRGLPASRLNSFQPRHATRWPAKHCHFLPCDAMRCTVLVIVILSVCLSVRLSVCHTRALCPHGSTYDHDFFTIW